MRSGRDSLRVEGMPPIPFRYLNTGDDGALTTRLSILNATYRHRFAGGWYAGIGQTVYNQMTSYDAPAGSYFYDRGSQQYPIVGSEAQYSRVTGARFEAGHVIARGRDEIDVWAAANPRMRGVQYTRIPSYTLCSRPFGGVTTCTQLIDTFADPENASQLDLSLRVAHRVSKRGDLLYGVRYLNYSAHYDDIPGRLADRNVGFAPVLGYRLRF